MRDPAAHVGQVLLAPHVVAQHVVGLGDPLVDLVHPRLERLVVELEEAVRVVGAALGVERALHLARAGGRGHAEQLEVVEGVQPLGLPGHLGSGSAGAGVRRRRW